MIADGYHVRIFNGFDMVRWGGVWWTYFFWSETNLLANTAVMVVWGGILVTYWILSVSWWGQGEQTGGMGQEKIVGNNIKKIMLNITISSIQMQNNIDLNMVLSKIYYQKNDSVSKFLFFLLLFGPKRISGLVWVVVNYLNWDAIAKVLSN